MAVKQASQRSLVKDLLVLSRFHKYNPIFACFSGVWSVLLAGAAKLGDEPGSLPVAFVFRQAALCFLAAYAFCGAGMVWNDWVDRDIDANVARTKDRPLAAGTVTTAQAMVWMAVQVAASWAILEVMLDGKDVPKHFFPVALASVAYPFGKRPIMRSFYFYPQYILGFTIAWPAIIGWAAIFGRTQNFGQTCAQCAPLCVMTYFWTLYLNTAYSYQDVVDDRKMGVNSLYNVAPIRLLLVGLVAPMFVCMPLFLRDFASPWLWASWMGVWTVCFVVQLGRFDPKRPASGGALHKNNFALGVWTILACVAEVFLKDGGFELFRPEWF